MAHGAAVRIQKHIKGVLTRIKYKRSLKKQQRYWLVCNAIAKLGLDPEDPYDLHNYHTIVWYDLLRETMIFQIKRIFNKKQFYSTKVQHPHPDNYQEHDFFQEISDLAISMVPLMFLEANQLKFKPG